MELVRWISYGRKLFRYVSGTLYTMATDAEQQAVNALSVNRGHTAELWLTAEWLAESDDSLL